MSLLSSLINIIALALFLHSSLLYAKNESTKKGDTNGVSGDVAMAASMIGSTINSQLEGDAAVAGNVVMGGASATMATISCSGTDITWSSCIFWSANTLVAGVSIADALKKMENDEQTLCHISPESCDVTDDGGGDETDPFSTPDLVLGNGNIIPKQEVNRLKNMANQFINTGTKNGLSLGPDGSISAGGNTFAPGTFKNRSSMKAAGISDSDISAIESGKAKVMEKVKQAMKNNKGLAKVKGGPNLLSGGGGPNVVRRKVGRTDNSSPNFGSLFGNKTKNKTPKISGLSKKLGNNQIGIARDNIFDMVSRGYQRESFKLLPPAKSNRKPSSY